MADNKSYELENQENGDTTKEKTEPASEAHENGGVKSMTEVKEDEKIPTCNLVWGIGAVALIIAFIAVILFLAISNTEEIIGKCLHFQHPGFNTFILQLTRLDHDGMGGWMKKSVCFFESNYFL